MSRVLAVDGGQSTIRLGLPDGEVVERPGIGRLAGASALRLVKSITDVTHGLGPEGVDVISLGLTTAPQAPAELDALAREIGSATGIREVLLCDDTVTGHASAFAGEDGVSLVAGTGVACLALRSPQPPRTYDGHGFLLGDQGGGFWLGARGLNAVLTAHDSGKRIALSGVAEEDLGSLDGLAVRLHEDADAVNRIAQFARRVQGLAASDDVASHLLDTAAIKLLSTLLAGTEDFESDHVRVALGGRALTPGSPLRTRLTQLADRATRPLSIIPEAADPLDGARHLADAGVRIRYQHLVHRWMEEA